MGQKNRKKSSKKQRSSDIPNGQLEHIISRKSSITCIIKHDVTSGSANYIVDASKNLPLNDLACINPLSEKPLSLGSINKGKISDIEARIESPHDNQFKDMELRTAIRVSDAIDVSIGKENRRFLHEQLIEFSSEKTSDDQRIKDLHSMNTLLEKTPQYMARCYLRNDLLSLGLLHGLKLCINTQNSLLKRQIERFFEGERRDNLQGDSNDPRSAIDILWKCLSSFKERESRLLMVDFLDILSKFRALTPPEWNRLISFVKNMSFCEDSPELSKEDESKEAVRRRGSCVTTESLHVDSGDLISPQNPCVPSASPAPSDPDHCQEANILSAPATMALDNLTLVASAPLPSIKLRPRSKSRLGIRKVVTQQRHHLEFSQDIASKISIPQAPPPPPPPPPGLLLRGTTPAPPPSNLPNSNIRPTSQTGGPPPAPPPPPSNLFGDRMTSRYPSSPSSTACSSPTSFKQPTPTSSSSFSQLSIIKSEEFYPKKKKTYTMLWEVVDQHTIQSVHTIWNEYSKPEFTSDERDQLQSVFERQELAKCTVVKSRKNSRNEPAFQLNQQKALNLEIMLAKLRPLSFMDLIERLETNCVDGISVDLLSSLLKYFPTDDEMSLLKNVAREDIKRNCDLMCWELARRRSLKMRAELAIAKEQIVGELSLYAKTTSSLKSASEVFHSSVVIRLLHKCLQYGNYINQGSAVAHAPGFLFCSLPSVLAAKGKNEHSSIRVADLLAYFVDFDLNELESTELALASARSIKLADMEKASNELSLAVNRLKAQLRSKGDEDLLTAYLPFIEEADSNCARLSADLQSLRTIEAKLQMFFCARNMMFEEMISTLADSLGMLNTAIKDRSVVKLRSKSETPSRPFFSRDTPSRGSIRFSRPSVDEVRQMFIDACNYNDQTG